MNTLTYRLGLPVLALIGSFPFASDGAAAPRLWVENSGLDSPSCGSTTNPCRSISQAIENGSDGDTIFVGPGHYGDVSGTGTFSGPGDEHPGPSGCLVCITKKLQIDSVDGASVTVIDGGHAAQLSSAVQILHDGAFLGYKGHGFTLSGVNGDAVRIDENAAGYQSEFPGVQQGISVGGNIALSSSFTLNGPGPEDGLCLVCSENTGQILFADNQAIGGGFAITVNALRGPGQIILRNNLALNAGTGFAVAAGIQTVFALNVSGDDQVQLLNNVASGCQLGFSTNLAGPIQSNTAINNVQAGFLVVPAGLIQYNSAIGNGGPGMILQFSPDPFTSSSAGGRVITSATVNNNNFFGNDRNRPVLGLVTGNGQSLLGTTYNPGPSAHCGILNVGALGPVIGPQPPPANTAPIVTAHFDYWGSSTGAHTSGPGDTVGGACDQNGAVTKSTPFSATAISVNSFQP